MIFTSFQFLYFLIAVTLSLTLIKKHQYQIYILLIASYIFYAAWNPYYVVLIILVSFIGWACGYLIHKSDNIQKKKLYLWISIIGSLLLLGYFKYANFFIQNINLVIDNPLSIMDIVLPVGISFFTFQSLSYTIDLYRERIPVCRSLPKFFLFVSFFPQLVAGPIVRASEFLPQLNNTITINRQNLIRGAQIFLVGAFQKVVIANNLSPFVDRIFDNPEMFTSGTVWLGVISYSIQIFCDFSGYSLMAIGIARIFGFVLPENFRMPYLSTSISEFWRRWHISLSFWLRDYLYISLGGNRLGEFRTLINLIITMVLGGLWHGASWNFVLWGFMHGLALVLHKLWSQASANFLSITLKESLAYKLIAWSLTYLFIILLWVPFRSADFATTMTILEKLFIGSIEVNGWYYTQALSIITLTCIWHIAYMFNNRLITTYPYQTGSLVNLLTVGGLFLGIVLFAPLNTSPFIYFQF